MSKKAVDPVTAVVDAIVLGLAYTGQDGAHISGIPARSLTPAEVALLSPEQVETCLKSKLYEVINES